MQTSEEKIFKEESKCMELRKAKGMETSCVILYPKFNLMLKCTCKWNGDTEMHNGTCISTTSFHPFPSLIPTAFCLKNFSLKFICTVYESKDCLTCTTARFRCILIYVCICNMISLDAGMYVCLPKLGECLCLHKNAQIFEEENTRKHFAGSLWYY